MIALSLLAYMIGVWFGEALRDVVYGKLELSQVPDALLNKPPVYINAHPKWLIYSGLFILLKQKPRLSKIKLLAVSKTAANAFASLLLGNVRSVLKIVHASIGVRASRLTL
jgi:hypothetical protein